MIEQRGLADVRMRVLVADDEVAIVEVVTFILVEAGFDVLSAFTGPEALEVARRERPDLILLDVMMPGLDGREVSRRLKDGAETSRIPVMLISALSVDLAASGADAYLAKPFDVDALVHQAERLTRTA